MSLLERAKSDIEFITGNLDHFSVDITLTAPTGEILATKGLHKKHHTGIDINTGEMINSKVASISIAESNLTGYPVRVSGEVYLKGHKVTVKDSTGIDKNYIIKEWYPDETIGLIVCILSWA